MPIFNYTALKNNNELVKGNIEATSFKEAREKLRNKQLTPTKLTESSKGSSKKDEAKKSTTKFKGVKLNLREKINFTKSLNVLIKTGVSLIEALLFIEQNFDSKKVQILATDIRKQILSGQSMSDAILRHPKTFDQIYIGLVKSGEESGELDYTLKRMCTLLEKQDKLIAKIKGVMFYPCFILFLSGVVTTIMLVFVFPEFEKVFAGLGAELPIMTRLMIDTGKFLKANWIYIPIIFILTIASIYTIIVWDFTKRIIDRILLKIPLLKTFVTYVALANFLSVMSISFEAGIPIIDSLKLSNLTINNKSIKEKFSDIIPKIRQGQSFSASLKATGAVPNIIMAMISTGEQSGQLGELLLSAGEFVDEQLENIIELLNKMLEPLLLVFIGIVVFVLAISLYLPMFQSYANMM